METSIEPDAYVAIHGIRSLRPAVLGLVVPTIFIVVGVLNWAKAWIFAIIGLAIAAVLMTLIALRLRRIARRESTLVIDSRGVWLGGDGIRPPVREPWSKIDAVVYFDSWLKSRDLGRRVPHIGFVRERKIVNVRDVSDWRIDHARARAAIARFGGVPFREAPVQDDIPIAWYQGITLPDDWFTAPA